MKSILKLAAPCAALIAYPCLAQTAGAPAAATAVVQSAAPEPVASLLPSTQPNILRAGTAIALVTREELTTKKKKLRVGQRFQMEVAENVQQNGVVVIPSGTPAIGEITEVRNKGMWGKSGYIGARVVSLTLAGRNVRMSGSFDDKGVTGTGGVVAAIAFVPIAGFLTTGTSAFIASGSGVKGFLDEDLAFQPVAPQVIQVPVAVPAVPAATGQTTTPAAVTR
jgi:hypothetical protein